MKLIHRWPEDFAYSNDEYRCEITHKIDSCCNRIGIFYNSYIYDARSVYDHWDFVIRVPGRSIGGIELDEDNKIIRILIDEELISKCWYPKNMNEILQEFVGEILEVE